MISTVLTRATIDMMGEDWEVEIEVEVYSWGESYSIHSASIYPPDPPEWSVTGINLRLDRSEGFGAAWEINPNSALFEVLAEDYRINSAAAEAVAQEASFMRYEGRARRRAF